MSFKFNLAFFFTEYTTEVSESEIGKKAIGPNLVKT